MAIDDLNKLAVFVVGDDAVALEFGLFDFFCALAGADKDVFKFNFVPLGLFEVIHDDLDLSAHRSSGIVVEGERRLLGFSCFFGLGSGRLICGQRTGEKERREEGGEPEF